MTREEIAVKFSTELIGRDLWDSDKEAIDHAVYLTDYMLKQLAQSTPVGTEEDLEDEEPVASSTTLTGKKQTSWFK